MPEKPGVLFLCTANSCRSQMAEGWLRHLAGERLRALSAGTAPTAPHPVMVRVMAEAGIDVTGQTSDALEAHLVDPPALVIAVCDAAARTCPRLVGDVPVLSWPFDDPAAVTGDERVVRVAFRATRDAIGARIRAWLEEGCPGLVPARVPGVREA